MKVSVIVPNHNRDITPIRESVRKSTYKNVEFIEINRGLERSAQRNIGIKEATGDVILWLDSDQTVSPDLIRECVYWHKVGFSAIYIPEIIVGRSFFARIRAWERSFYTSTAVDVPRSILKRCMPLFDETLHGPEDADMGNRITGLRATTKNPLYHHDDIGFFDYCRKKAYYSKSMVRYAEKNPNDPCLRLKYRCWTVFTEKSKWKKIFKHPILSIGVVFLLIVRGYIYYANR
jgi:glycosyltransferase involved in cell wall biosynthesis